MRKTVWLLPAVTFLLLSCGGGAAPPPFRPVADLKLLMDAVIDPAADTIWGAAGTIITVEGREELAPKNDEEWTAVRNSAVALTESGNLLMMSPRAKDGDQWMKMSQALIDTGTAAIRAADAKDVGRIFSAGGDIYVVCSNCHASYMDTIVQSDR